MSLFNNDSEPDGEDFFIDSVMQPAIGSVIIDDADAGLVTYTYSVGIPFPGTTFDYTITDSAVSICPALGMSDTATVTIFEPCADTSGLDSNGDDINNICDEDDDNDGILDVVESPRSVLWVTNGTPGSEDQNSIDKLIALGCSVSVVDDNIGGDANSFDVTFIYEDVFSGDAFANVSNMTTTTKGVITSENTLHDELLGGVTGGSGNTNLLNSTNNTHPITSGLSLGNYDIGDAAYYANSLSSGTVLGQHPNGSASLVVWESGDAMETGTAPGRRTIVPHTNNTGGFNTAGEDLLINAIVWTAGIDFDKDSIDDDLDLDSDNDGIYDAVEAGHDVVHSFGMLTGTVGLDGVPYSVKAAGQKDSSTMNYTLQNSDGTSANDFIELDSDHDGCNDVLEAGYTDGDGVLGTSPVLVGGDGLIIGQGGDNTPLDNDMNTIFDFREADNTPSITVQPVDTTICPGCTGTFKVNANDVDTYQWQTFNGSSWVDLTDTGIYSGVTSASLTLTNVQNTNSGNSYRVVLLNSTYIRASETSDTVILTVQVSTVSTNRIITYRIDEN